MMKWVLYAIITVNGITTEEPLAEFNRPIDCIEQLRQSPAISDVTYECYGEDPKYHPDKLIMSNAPSWMTLEQAKHLVAKQKANRNVRN